MDSVARDPGRRGRLPLMDGLRGLAAVVVMTRHTEEFWPFWLYHSHLAVDVFFLLSGFVIARAYGERLRSGELSPARFMLIRLVRLYPMYLLSAAIAATEFIASSLHHGRFGMTPALTVLFMLVMLPIKEPGSVLLFPLEGAYWSLFFEVIVNAFYAKVVRLLSLRATTVVIGVAAAALVGVGLEKGGLNVGFSWGVLQFSGGLARAVFGIFLGATLERNGGDWAVTRRLRGHPWLALGVTLALMCLPSMGALDAPVDLVSVLLVFPVCLLALDAPVASPFAARGLMLLGSASYPLYVLHIPLALMALHFLAPANRLGYGIAFALVLVVLCAALERFVDEPVRRWLHRRIAGARQRPATPEPFPGSRPTSA